MRTFEVKRKRQKNITSPSKVERSAWMFGWFIMDFCGVFLLDSDKYYDPYFSGFNWGLNRGVDNPTGLVSKDFWRVMLRSRDRWVVIKINQAWMRYYCLQLVHVPKSVEIPKVRSGYPMWHFRTDLRVYISSINVPFKSDNCAPKWSSTEASKILLVSPVAHRELSLSWPGQAKNDPSSLTWISPDECLKPVNLGGMTVTISCLSMFNFLTLSDGAPGLRYDKYPHRLVMRVIFRLASTKSANAWFPTYNIL